MPCFVAVPVAGLLALSFVRRHACLSARGPLSLAASSMYSIPCVFFACAFSFSPVNVDPHNHTSLSSPARSKTSPLLPTEGLLEWRLRRKETRGLSALEGASMPLFDTTLLFSCEVELPGRRIFRQTKQHPALASNTHSAFAANSHFNVSHRCLSFVFFVPLPPRSPSRSLDTRRFHVVNQTRCCHRPPGRRRVHPAAVLAGGVEGLVLAEATGFKPRGGRGRRRAAAATAFCSRRHLR